MSPHSKNGCCREMTAGEHSGHELAATGPRTGYSNRGSTSSRRVPTRNCPTSVQWNGSTSFKKRYSNMRENLVGTYGLGQCYLITTTSLLHLQIQRVCRNSSANNRWDKTAGRKVWFQFWDSHITFERSYLARLKYVHHNPALHAVVPVAENYKWCSAAWFAETAPVAFINTVNSFKVDQPKVPDDF